MKMRADKEGDTSRKGDVLGSVLCGLAVSHTCKDGVTLGRGWCVHVVQQYKDGVGPRLCGNHRT